MIDKQSTHKMTYPSKYVEVLGSKMHYIETGEGDPILFLHGIPTSSYLWRNVLPHLATLGRCIAPDLIGLGQSDKPDIAYSAQDHIQYIDAFIQALGLKKITIVMHGWGSVIGFDYAMRHEKNMKGLVFYEAFLRSLNGEEPSLPLQEQLMALQDDVNAYDMTMSGTIFVDKIIPQNIMKDISDEDMNHYRKPFADVGSSKPILEYIKALSIANGKNDINKLIATYSDKLTHSSIPKLMLFSVPGFITTIADVIWAKEHLPNLEIVDIGEELHFAQESNPTLIGESISIWLQSIEQGV
jgi:haloalkane dehalogenase